MDSAGARLYSDLRPEAEPRRPSPGQGLANKLEHSVMGGPR